MAALLLLALVVAVAVLLHLHSGRRPRPDLFRPAAPLGSPSQDRDHQRLMAELRALGAADPPRLLS
jgi:hypothetical protein